jgi:5-methylcytosine-specific restriction endonuclease McrA
MEFKSAIEINLRLHQLVRNERKITDEILEHINLMETFRGFAELGFSSMYAYLTTGLGYSEDAAYRRLAAARLLKKSPLIKEKIKNGKLNLTQAAKIQTLTKNYSDSEEIERIVSLVENKSLFETETVLATELGVIPKMSENLKPQKDNSVRIEITFSEEQFKKLQTVKSLLSHQCPNNSLLETLEELCDQFLSKHALKPIAPATKVAEDVAGEKIDALDANNLKKNERKNISDKPTQCLRVTKASQKAKSRYIPINIRRAIYRRAQGKCEFVGKENLHCESTYQLQFDHKIPLSLHGGSELENTRLLCRTHNLAEAKRLGISGN